MRQAIGIAIAGWFFLAAVGCGETKQPPAPKGAANTSATKPSPSPSPSATTASAPKPKPTTAPAAVTPATGPAATAPAGAGAYGGKDFDQELAKVVQLTEQTEFFEAMKVCRDMQTTFAGHPKAEELSVQMRKLKEYRRDMAAMAEAIGGLASDSQEARRLAGVTLTQGADLGGIYLRKALRGGTGPAVGEAGRLLAQIRDPQAPPLLMARLTGVAPVTTAPASAPAAAPVAAATTAPALGPVVTGEPRATLLAALAALVEQTDPSVFRQAFSAVQSPGTALPAAAQLEWLEYLAAVCQKRAQGDPAKLQDLLGAPGAMDKLQTLVKAVAGSQDPAVAAKLQVCIAAFHIGVAYESCVLWLRADLGVQADEKGAVTKVADQSLTHHDATQPTAAAQPKLVRNKQGKVNGLDFDGTDDHLVMGEGFADFGKGITAMVWARPTNNGKWMRFVEFGNDQQMNSVVFACAEPPEDLALELNPEKQASTYKFRCVEWGRWQHLAATQDEKGNVVLYRSGKPVSTGTLPVLTKPVPRKLNFVARSNWPGDSYYKGQMDDLRVFTRALTAAEVAKVYEEGKPAHKNE